MRALSVHTAHEIAGAARIRHSLRPLIFEGESYLQTSGAMRRENADTYSAVIVCEGGRSSIPETSMIEPIGRGVLDHPPSRVTTAAREATPTTSLHPSPRQIPPRRRQEEDRDVDRKSDAPEDRAQGRAVAEIGEDIGDPHDQKQHRQLVDGAQRPEAKLRQQHGDRKERKGFDAVLMGAERAG